VNSSCDHASENKNLDFLRNFAFAHFDFEWSGKVKTNIVKRFNLLAKVRIQKWSHQLSVDCCFDFPTFCAARLDWATESSHAIDGKLVVYCCFHGLDANWVLMLNMSSFDNESGIIQLAVKDDRMNFFVSETRNVCKPRSTSHNSSGVQKWDELLNGA
jgi:hypothetical protein